MSDISHTNSPEQAASDIADKARSNAETLAAKARTAAESKVEEAAARTRSAIDEKAASLRSASSSFEPGSYEAQAADYVAANLSRAADFVREQDFSTLTNDVTRFARQNPAIFLGGAAVVGFALARMLKASESDHVPHYAHVSGTRGYTR